MIPRPSPKARLDLLRRMCKWATLAEMAHDLGLPPTTFRQQRNRDSIPKEVVEPLINACKKRGVIVTERWIMTGKGAPPVTLNASDSPPDDIDVSLEHEPDESQHYVAVREFDVRAAMGGGSLVDSEKYIGSWALPQSLIRAQTTAALSNLTFIQAIGESMAPDFPPGSRVLVDLSDTVPTPPGIFIVWDGMGVVLKRVELIPHSKPPRIRLSSIHPAYPPYERTLDESLIRGRVLGRWAWV